LEGKKFAVFQGKKFAVFLLSFRKPPFFSPSFSFSVEPEMPRALLLASAVLLSRGRALAGAAAPLSRGRALAGAAALRGQSLTGELFFGTCDLPSCDTLAFAALNLTDGSEAPLFDFPLDSFEDGYVASNVLIGGAVVMSLQYDGAPSQGFLATFDVAARRLTGGFNASFCFGLWADPADASGDALLCMALEPRCDGGAQCSQLRRLSRGARTDELLFSFAPDMAPYTVDTLDAAKGLVYSLFGPLNGGGGDVLYHVNASGVVAQVPVRHSLAFLELEYDAKSGAVYAVVEDAAAGAPQGAYLATVDAATGAATPVGGAPNVMNGTYWNQWNTVSTIAPEIGAFFSTAFHYAQPGPPPSDPILHLIGNSLVDGEPARGRAAESPIAPPRELQRPRRSSARVLTPPPLPRLPHSAPTQGPSSTTRSSRTLFVISCGCPAGAGAPPRRSAGWRRSAKRRRRRSSAGARQGAGGPGGRGQGGRAAQRLSATA